MPSIAIVVGWLLFFGLGMMIGFELGHRASERIVSKRDYLLANGAALIVGVVLAMLIQATGLVLLTGVAIGSVAGFLTGLKFGFGESTGPWKAHDRFFRVNSEHLKASEDGSAERRRRRAREGGAEPELMSTVGTSAETEREH